ncbi:hypothetical protein RQP46_007551 [Phenoliferia psychrophenolica]
MGINLTERECSAYAAVWKLVGHYIGIESELLEIICPTSFTATEVAFANLFFGLSPPDAPIQPAVSTAPLSYEVLAIINSFTTPSYDLGYNFEYARMILGPALANQLAIPDGTWSDWFAVQRDVNLAWMLVEFGRHWRSGWEAERVAFSNAQARRLVQTMKSGKAGKIAANGGGVRKMLLCLELLMVDSVSFKTGLFINNEFVAGEGGKTIDVVNPSTGKVIAAVSEASAKDVDAAVDAAEHAYNTVWGEKVPGHQRGKMLMQLATLFEEHADVLASIESMDNGKAFSFSRAFDVSEAAACLRYYGGWADKDHGKVIEVDDSKLAYTRHEPIGVVGQIIYGKLTLNSRFDSSPILMFAWKLGPALATGNTIVLKVAESTPLSALYAAQLVAKVFPPGVVNIITGYGNITGTAITQHMKINKVAFTGSTAVGRQVMIDAANSNIKNVTLELGGKSPNIIFDDADLEEEGIYDKFLERLTEKVHSLQVGSPFSKDTFQGPQNSELQFNRIMAHIQSGKDEGATVHTGGERHGTEGYFIQPTVFTDVKPNMRIVREEIFGPVLVVSKFKDEADIVAKANDTIYGLAAAVFSRDISRAIGTAHKLHAGTVWINCYNQLNSQMPFGGFKESGIGRELGEYALHNYTGVKAVHVNLHAPCPI